MEPPEPTDSLLFVLDSSGIVNGANLPPRRCRTTASVVGEFRPGGATRRRLDLLLAAGMAVVEPTPASLERSRRAADRAGSRARLSRADLDLLAACLDAGPHARLVTDDYTLLDVATRLGIAVDTVATRGIEALRDWAARCSGCGRTYKPMPPDSVCPICGSLVRLKPQPRPR